MLLVIYLRKIIASLCVFYIFLPVSQAAGIIDFYFLALENDPAYLAALQGSVAGKEAKNIARADLLPKLSFNYQNMPRNKQIKQYQTTSFTGKTTQITERQQYHSYNASLIASLPVFNYEAYARYKIGIIQSMMADDRQRVALLDLAERVINTYINILYAQDNLSLISSKKKVYLDQITLNQHLQAAGEGSLIDIEETRAQLSLNEIQEIEAKDELDAAWQELTNIVGLPREKLESIDPLKLEKFFVQALKPARFDDWKQIAIRNNPELAVLRSSVEIAKQEIERSRAGFMPDVQLYAAYSQSNSDSESTIDQKYKTQSMGLHLSMPIYSGGGVIASTRQAAALYGQVKGEMDAKTGSIFNTLRRQFNLCTRGQSRLLAYETRVQSTELQVKASRKSMLAGQRTNLDVLNAEQEFHRAKFDLITARYQYLKEKTGLLKNAGILNEENIVKIASYFSPETRSFNDQ